MPKNCRKSLEIWRGPQRWLHSVETFLFGRTRSKCFFWVELGRNRYGSVELGCNIRTLCCADESLCRLVKLDQNVNVFSRVSKKLRVFGRADQNIGVFRRADRNKKSKSRHE